MSSFRLIDRPNVRLPTDWKFPLAMKNWLSWLEPSGHRGYVVFKDEVSGHLLGIAMRRTLGSADAAPVMCQWCHTVRGAGGVSLLTATASPTRQVGIYLCSNLDCEAGISKDPSIHDLRESLDKSDRQQRCLGRMQNFARQNLF